LGEYILSLALSLLAFLGLEALVVVPISSEQSGSRSRESLNRTIVCPAHVTVFVD
jgi:hypothetical protein